MNKFRIDIYATERDDSYNVTSERCGYSAIYQTSETVEDVLNYLHRGEGISIELIKTTDDIPLIRFNHLFGSTPDSLVKSLNSKYELLVSGDFDELNTINESNEIIAIGEIDSLSDNDALEFEKFIQKEFDADLKSLTKTISIYEWGASGYFADFIINLTAGFSQKGIGKIYDFFKKRDIEHIVVKKFDTAQLKKMVGETFEVNPGNLKLISSRTYNGQTRFVFSSRFIEFILKIDEEGNLIESNRRDLNQTGI